jgi:hypothetical protein
MYLGLNSFELRIKNYELKIVNLAKGFSKAASTQIGLKNYWNKLSSSFFSCQ